MVPVTPHWASYALAGSSHFTTSARRRDVHPVRPPTIAGGFALAGEGDCFYAPVTSRQAHRDAVFCALPNALEPPSDAAHAGFAVLAIGFLIEVLVAYDVGWASMGPIVQGVTTGAATTPCAAALPGPRQ